MNIGDKVYKEFEILESAKEKYPKNTSAFKSTTNNPKKVNNNNSLTDKTNICNTISQRPKMTYPSQFPNLMPKSALRGGKTRSKSNTKSRIKTRSKSKTRCKSKFRIKTKSKTRTKTKTKSKSRI